MASAMPHGLDWEHILDSLADGVYVTDRDRRIVFWNRAAEHMTGWTSGEILGQTCFDGILVHEDLDGNPLCGEEFCPLHRAILSGRSSVLPDIIFAKRKNGRRMPLEVAVAPLRDRRGGIVGGVESFRDLSPLLQDLERARLIQNRAVGHGELPVDPRVFFAVHDIPEEYVSGDVCRIEAVDEDTFAILLADVMGHGIPAALYTIQIRTVWEEARHLLPDPPAFVGHLNNQLCALTGNSGQFATAFYAILDVGTMAIRYVTAGHPTPFLLRRKQVLDLTGSGCALGMLPDLTYEGVTLALQPLDRIVAYTDGAIELTDDSDNELGIMCLRQLLAAEVDELTASSLSATASALLKRAGRRRFADDVTLLGITLR